MLVCSLPMKAMQYNFIYCTSICSYVHLYIMTKMCNNVNCERKLIENGTIVFNGILYFAIPIIAATHIHGQMV